MLGYVTPSRRSNASGLAVLPGSRTLIPRKATRDPRFFAAALSLPLSARHGPHHDPQTLTTTGFPAKSCSETCLPCSVAPLTSSGTLRLSTGTRDTEPSPATYPLSPVAASLPQPATAAPARRAATGSSRRSGRGIGSAGRRVVHGVATGGEVGLAVGVRDQVAGRLGEADRDQVLVDERERRQAAEGAQPPARVVQVRTTALGAQPRDPDRQLVRDQHGLVAVGRVPGVEHRRPHALGDLLVGLAPRGPERVPQVLPRRRHLDHAVADRERLALE